MVSLARPTVTGTRRRVDGIGRDRLGARTGERRKARRDGSKVVLDAVRVRRCAEDVAVPVAAIWPPLATLDVIGVALALHGGARHHEGSLLGGGHDGRVHRHARAYARVVAVEGYLGLVAHDALSHGADGVYLRDAAVHREPSMASKVRVTFWPTATCAASVSFRESSATSWSVMRVATLCAAAGRVVLLHIDRGDGTGERRSHDVVVQRIDRVLVRILGLLQGEVVGVWSSVEPEIFVAAEARLLVSLVSLVRVRGEGRYLAGERRRLGVAVDEDSVRGFGSGKVSLLA